MLEDLQVNVGADFADFGKPPQAVQDWHEALTAEGYTLLGGGVAYSVLDSVTLDVLIRQYVAGTNSRDSTLVGLGLSWKVL